MRKDPERERESKWIFSNILSTVQDQTGTKAVERDRQKDRSSDPTQKTEHLHAVKTNTSDTILETMVTRYF